MRKKVYVLHHTLKIYDNCIGVTTDEELVKRFKAAKHDGWFVVDEHELDDPAEIAMIELRIKFVNGEISREGYEREVKEIHRKYQEE